MIWKNTNDGAQQNSIQPKAPKTKLCQIFYDFQVWEPILLRIMETASEYGWFQGTITTKETQIWTKMENQFIATNSNSCCPVET